MERHLQSFLLGLLSLVCGWLGFTVQDSTIKIAALTERVAYLQSAKTDDAGMRYTASDAAKDLRLRDEVLSNLASRVLNLEKRNSR
jgi:hypothetical protein